MDIEKGSSIVIVALITCSYCLPPTLVPENFEPKMATIVSEPYVFVPDGEGAELLIDNEDNVYWLHIVGGDVYYRKYNSSHLLEIPDEPLYLNGTNEHVDAVWDVYGNIHFTWATDFFGAQSVMYAKIDKSGSFLVPPTKLSGNNTARDHSSAIDVNSLGQAFVAWDYWWDPSLWYAEDVVYAKIDSDGSIVFTQQYVAPENWDTAFYGKKDIVIDSDDNLHVLFDRVYPDVHDIHLYYKKYGSDGITPLVTEKKLISAAYYYWSSTLEAMLDSRNRINIAYSLGVPNKKVETFYTRIDLQGNVEIAPIQLSQGDAYHSHQAYLTMDRYDNSYVFWRDDATGNGDIYYSALDTNGSVVIGATGLTSNNSSQQTIYMGAVFDSDYFCIWSYYDENGTYVVYRSNLPPVADAGPDQTVYVGDVVQFDGSGSYDPIGGWMTTTVDFVDDVGKHLSIALDSNDNTHIAYKDDTNDFLKYTNWTGGSWNFDMVDPIGKGEETISLALDSNDWPHISYFNHADKTLKYAKWTGSNWSIETVDSMPGSGSWNSLALDSNDDPHIAYYYGHPGYDLKYAKWTGITWGIETVDEDGDVGWDISIAIGNTGRPHISYLDKTNEDLKYAKWTGSAWSIEVVDSANRQGHFTSLAVDNNDNPHISYLDFTNWSLKYATWTGNFWDIEIADGVDDVGWGTSIALDSNDDPHISYSDFTNQVLKYARRTGGHWNVETVDINHIHIWETSIALDGSDNPHISYTNLGIGNYDLKYANKSGGIVSYDWDFGDGSPHGSGVSPTHVYTTPGIYNVTLTVTDAQGATDTDNCIIMVLQTDQPPVADAGLDQTVDEGNTVFFDGTGSYDPDDGDEKWSPKASIPSPRSAGASTVLNGEIYYIGGDGQDLLGPGPSSVFQKYNPATDSWSDLADLPEPRVYLGAATIGGKIYAMGGSDGTHSSNTTYEFDPATNSWTSKAPIPIPMEAFGTAVVDDKIYLVGGWSTFVYCYPCAFVFEYDPSTDSWSQKKDIPTGRAKLATTVLDDRIFAVGGHPTTVSNVVEVYDPATKEWSRRSNLTTGRWSLSTEVLGGNIYAFGGIVNWDLATDVNEMYDPAKDRWASKPSMLDIRMDSGSGLVGDCIYAVGGYRGFMAGHPEKSEEYCLGGELTYEWDFDVNVDSDGDGNFTNDKEATGPTPTHVYYDDGVYTVTLTVTNSGGLQDMDQCNITVLNVPPTPEWTSRSVDGTILNPPYPEGKEILFEATVYDPGIYDTFTYDWDFGDGTILLDAGPSVVHAYGDNDTYIVVLKVTDDDGGVGIDDTPPLLTTNEDPVAWISLPRCPFFEGVHACPIDGYFTDPGWLDTHSAVWNFGDGEYEIAVITEENEPPDATGLNETAHIYGDNGVYDITFTVVDDDGGTDTAWAVPYVLNLPPSLAVDAPSYVKEGECFLLAITATDPGSDDLFIDIDWGDGISETETYYNNGVGPDPPNSGPGVYPFTIYANFSHTFGDDGNFTITVKVEDDDGGVAIDETIIIVENVPPTIEYFDYFFNASFAFRIAGEKWHNVEFHLFEDSTEIGYVNITRYPGSPDDQMAHLADVSIDFSKRYSAIAYYTPMDDPVNGQIWGATPAWVIMSYEDGSEERIHHTFNVRHKETWTWVIDDFTSHFIGHNITFVAIAFDPGSDDLIFKWDWGDGTSTEHIYYNNGVSPDPYPSPDVNPITIADKATHSYALAGTYTITLTVTDDDGGQATFSIVLGI